MIYCIGDSHIINLQPYGDGQPFGDSSHLASKFVVPIVMESLGMNELAVSA